LLGGGKGREPFPATKRRKRRAIAAAVGLLLLLLVLDQLGIRRLSGADFPPQDPLGLDLRAHVERLAAPAWEGRKPGTPGNDEAARYLAQQLEAAGLAALPSLGGYLAPLPEGAGRLGHNVVGYLPGTGAAGGGAVILGAHFDHLGQTEDGLMLGADDNASGVAVLLGAVSALRRRTLRHPVFVVFFNTEEAPYFGTPHQGSRAFLASLPPEIGARASIRLAVVLDLIGGVVWGPSADTIFACGAEKAEGLPELVDATREEGLTVRRLGISMVENLPGYRPQAFSDYDVFRDERVPFLFLSSGRTPRYHHATDLPDTLHYDRMARTSRWIASLVASVDGRDATPRFDPTGADRAADLATMRWALDAAAMPWRSIPGTGPITAIRLLADRARIRAMEPPGRALTREDELALERASFRLQCLLYSFPVCFTF
jgi:hypothetical protein